MVLGHEAIAWQPFPGAETEPDKYETARQALPKCPGPGQVDGSSDKFCGVMLDWARPATENLQPGRRLLATGRYEDDADPPNMKGCFLWCQQDGQNDLWSGSSDESW